MNRMSLRSHALPIANEIPPRRLDGAKIRFINFLQHNLDPPHLFKNSSQKTRFRTTMQTRGSRGGRRFPELLHSFVNQAANAIPPGFEKRSLCNEPGSIHNVPVCSVETPLITRFGSNTLDHCRFCTITFLLL